MKKALQLLKRCDSGVALIEFGIVLPFLMLMLLGMMETARFAIIIQKLDKTTDALDDYVTQGTTVCQADLNTYALAANSIMSPFPFTGTIIFSSVVSDLNVPPICTAVQDSCISWQYPALGGGLQGSKIGSPGGAADLGAYILPTLQNAIVVEIYYSYSPMFDYTGTLVPALKAQPLYRIAIYKPRQGSMTTLC